VKVLPESLGRDPQKLRRFMREVERISGLNHPNIAVVFEVDEADGLRFVVSELPDGETLREVLKRGALPPHQATKYALQIASGLAAALAAGIIHRDLRPENILVTKDGIIKIVAWGMGQPPNFAGLEEKTEHGTIPVGVVAYTAPIWMTFRQATELNAHVRKGEKGSLVVFANAITRTEHDDKTGEDVKREIPYMKGYTVFNVEQIEGLPEIYYAKAAPALDPVARIDHAEKFFASTAATIKHGGNRAYYAAGTGLCADAPLRSLPRCRELLRHPRP
jgi:serine/threonine protein kinase